MKWLVQAAISGIGIAFVEAPDEKTACSLVEDGITGIETHYGPYPPQGSDKQVLVTDFRRSQFTIRLSTKAGTPLPSERTETPKPVWLVDGSLVDLDVFNGSMRPTPTEYP